MKKSILIVVARWKLINFIILRKLEEFLYFVCCDSKHGANFDTLLLLSVSAQLVLSITRYFFIYFFVREILKFSLFFDFIKFFLNNFYCQLFSIFFDFFILS